MTRSPRRSKTYIVVDLETGGTDPKANPILEVAFVCLEFQESTQKYAVTEELNYLVKPYRINSKMAKIEEQALAINKLNMSLLEEKANDLKDVVDIICGLADSLNPTREARLRPILVGHNIAEFDILFLETAFKECSRTLYTYFRRANVDTYMLIEMILGANEQIDTLSLGNVCRYFGISLKNSHTALADARANALLFLRLLSVFSIKRNRKEYLSL